MDDAERDEVSRQSGEQASEGSGLLAGVRSRAKRVLIRSVVGILLLAGVGWVAASMGLGMRFAVPFVLDRVATEGWQVDVGTVDGSWLDRIEISGLSLTAPDMTIAVERITLDYRLIPLLNKTVDARSLVLERPVARFEVVDSTAGDDLGSTAGDERPDEEPVDFDDGPSSVAALLAGREVGAWTIRAQDVDVVDGHVEVLTGPGARYSVAGLHLAAAASMGAEGLAVSVDTLGADFISVLEAATDSVFRSAGRLALAGSLRDGELLLDTLTLRSDHSRVAGAGRMAFAARPELWEQVSVEILARPLDLRDLPFGLPEALRDRPEVDVRLRATGSPDSLIFVVDGGGFGGTTTIDAAATLRTSPSRGVSDEAPPALEGSIRIDGLDLSSWSAPPFDGSASGEVDFVLDALGPSARYSADGSVLHRPRDADVSRIVARPLEATVEVTGRTPGDSAAATPLLAEARLTLATGRPSREGVDSSPLSGFARLGRITADIRGSSAEWALDLTVDSSRVEGGGTADWGPDATSVLVDELRVARLNLLTIDTLYPDTDLTGRLDGRLDAASGRELSASVDLVLASSRLMETPVDTLSLQSQVRGTTFDGSLFAETGYGDLQARYVVERVDSVVRFEADELRYARADSVATEPPPVELHGRVAGTWALAELRRAALTAVIDSARWSGTQVEGGRVEARLRGEHLEGEAQLTARGPLPSAVRVRALVDAEGTGLASITGSASLTAERAHRGSIDMSDALRLEVDAPEPGRFEARGLARPGEGGGLSLTGSARVDTDSLRFVVEADGAFPEPAALLGGATLDSLHLTGSGRRVGGDWLALAGNLVLSDGSWEDLRASRALASLRFDSAGIRLDTLDLRSNVVDIHARGRLPLAGSGGRIDVRADLVDLEPLREMAGLEVLAAGDGTLQADVSGSLDSLDWRGEVGLEAMVLDRVRMTGVRLEGEGLVAAPHDFLLGLRSSDVELTLDRILLPESEVRRVSVQAAGGPDSIRVDARAVADGRRSASMLLHVDPRRDRRTVRIEDVRFQIDQDLWRLAEEAIVEYREGVSLEPVLLRAGEQEIRLEGGVSTDGVLDLNARMDSTDVGTVADLAGFPRLRGWLSGRVRVRGSTAAPEAWVDVAGALHRANRRPGPMEMTIRANGRQVRGEVQLMDARRGLLTVTGGALLPGARRGAQAADPAGSDGGAPPADTTVFGLVSDSIDVAVRADSFDLRWTEALYSADVLASVRGRLDGSLTLRGSSAEPVLEGELQVRDGAAEPTALGVSWDGLAMTVRGDGARLIIDPARISSSTGSARLNGSVDVVGSVPLDLELVLDEFQAIQTDAYWAVLSGNLEVVGAAMAPELQGELRIESLDVFLDERVTSEGLEPVELDDEDLRMLRDRFGIVPDSEEMGRPVSERLTADLQVVLGRDSWLRKRTSPEMAVPFSGTLDVALRPGEEPTLQGSLEVIEGRGFVEQFGRRFELSSGTVTFDGAPDQTSLDLEATYTVPSHDNPDDAEVTIILEVTGTQEDLGLTLSSDPPLENADIVSYIATGRPASGSLSFAGGESEGEGGLVAAGADFALGQMTSLIETAAARSVGLDVVEIRREGLRQATLVAGKYVTPRLYVGFAQPISLQEGDGLSFGSEGRSELEIEYEALRWLLVNIEGSGSSVRLFLRGRRAY